MANAKDLLVNVASRPGVQQQRMAVQIRHVHLLRNRNLPTGSRRGRGRQCRYEAERPNTWKLTSCPLDRASLPSQVTIGA